MTKQEVFDTAVRGLASQGWRQSKNGKWCAYRGREGRRCAAGWLFPDSVCEGYNVESAISEFRLSELDEHVTFIVDMQEIHDGCRNPEIMCEAFRNLAEAHSLTWPQDR